MRGDTQRWLGKTDIEAVLRVLRDIPLYGLSDRRQREVNNAIEHLRGVLKAHKDAERDGGHAQNVDYSSASSASSDSSDNDD